MNKDTLPNNIIKFDAIRVEKSKNNICNCSNNAEYVIDPYAYTVHCRICGAKVEPFRALLNITQKTSEFNKQLNIMLEQRQEIVNYKPHRVVIKQLEKLYNKSSRGKANLGTKYYPCCPSCKEPFELEEITDNWKGGINTQQKLYTRQNKGDTQ